MKKNKSGRLTVLSEEKIENKIFYKCLCRCGNEVIVSKNSILNKRTKSCGCLRLERSTTHGLAPRKNRPKLYAIWAVMKDRCLNKNNKRYPYYGGRGIKICKRWMSFKNFYNDMGEKPEGLSIDRINNDGDYKPSNCRWATHSQQQKNKRRKVKCLT